MRDCHAFVTRYVTRESRYPVPSRPYPTRPALYIGAWSPPIHSSSYVMRASRFGWMEAK